MSADIAELGIRVDSRQVRQGTQALDDLARQGDRAEQSTRALESAARGLTNVLAAMFATMSISHLATLSDTYSKVTAQLKLATDSQRDFANAYAEVRRIAQASQQDLAATGTLYAKIAQGTKELGLSQRTVAGITESVALALKVSGASAEEAASAQLQLAQAFASGVLRGEEFNAVNEAAPRLLQALADGMGVPAGALRKMAEEGQLTADVLARVLPQSVGKLTEEAKQIQTIGGALTELKNEMLLFVGASAQTSGTVAALTGGIGALAENLDIAAGAVLVLTAARLGSWLDVTLTRTMNNVAGNRALAASTLAAAQAEAAATTQASMLANVRLAEVRASMLAASGAAQLAIATNGVIPAQARAVAAAEAHAAAMLQLGVAQRAAAASTTAMSAVIGALGGPIGFVITILGIAATAWSVYQSRQEEANRKAAEQTEKSTSEIIASIEKQNAKLRERIVLAKQAGVAEIAQGGRQGAERLAEILGEINRLKSQGNSLSAVDQVQMANLQGEYDRLLVALQQAAGLKSQLDANDANSSSALTAIRERLNGVNSNYLKDLAALQAAREKGAVSESEYVALVSKLATETYKASEAGKAAAAGAKVGETAAQRQEKAYQDLINSIQLKIAETEREANGMAPLNDAQRLMIKLNEDLRTGELKLTPAREASARAAIKAYEANLMSIESQKAAVKMRDELEKAQRAEAKARQDQIDAAEKEADANVELVATFGMTKSAVAELEVARLEAQLAQRSDLALTWDEIKVLEQLIVQKKRSAAAIAKVEDLEHQRDLWRSIEDTAHQTFVSIMDGGKDAATRLKDTFKNIFFDWLYQQTLKKWIINLQGNASLSSLGGVADTAKSLLGSGNLIGSLSSAITGGFASLSGGIANAVQAGLYATGLSSSLLTNGALASTLGAAVPIAGAAALAVSVFQKAFGHGPKTTTGTGITGTFGVDSFAGENYTEWMRRGGWFSSTKRGTDTSPLGAEQSAAINSAYKAIKDSTAAFAEALGVPADVVTSYSKTIKLAFTGDTTKDQQLLADLFAQMGDELATRVLPNIGQFIQQGETAATTLQRVANNFAATNAIMQAIGIDGVKAFGAVGVASIEARERLVAMAGGVDQLASLADYFAQNFMSKAERMAPVQKAVAEQMAALGHAGVTTNDQFKDLVMGLASSGALATEAGAKTYAALLALAPAFKTVADAAAAAREKTASLEEQIFALTHTDGEVLARQREAELAALSATDRALQLRIYALQDEAAAAEATAAALEKNEASLRAFVDSAMDAVQRAVEAQRKAVQKAYDSGMAALQVRIDGVTTTISTLNDLAGVLKNGLSSMTMQGTETATRAAAQAQIEAALAIARVGGALPTADNIRDAVGLASKTSTDDFSSFIEYQRDFVRTSSALAELANLTDGQMTDAQKQLAALNAEKNLLDDWYKQQTESLDAALEKAQEQVDAINGVNTSVLSVAQALGLLAASIGNLKNGATPSNPTGTGMTMEQLYQTVLGRAPDAAGAAYWAPIFGDSIDEDDIRNFINGAQGELSGRVPGFANGGSHAGGWRVVGERGPELENTGPSRIVSNGGVQDLFGGLEARIESLETTLAVGLTRLIDETKRGADAAEEFADNTSDEEVIG